MAQRDALISDEIDFAQLKKDMAGAEFIAQQRYSDIERARFAKVIREFNELYYMMSPQTWGSTKWRGVPICKAPTDMWIYQELITKLRPDVIIETGTFCGGSALFMRDILHLSQTHGQVISIDKTLARLDDLAKVDGIKFLEAPSESFEALSFVKAYLAAYQCQTVMVILDSDHSHEHVLKELELYAPLVTVGSALIIEDTSNAPGPKSAMEEWFIEKNGKDYTFKHDYMCEKYMLTFNRDGYFERVK